MPRRYTLFFLLLGTFSLLPAQVVRVDSLINLDTEVSIVYSISDSLEGFRFHVDLFAIAGNDTLSLAGSPGYPTDSLEAGSYRMRWDAAQALGRYRGSLQVLVTARPGFRVTSPPELSYRHGQELKLRWYGGNAMNEQFSVVLFQGNQPVDTTELLFGVLSGTFPITENIKPGEGYSLRMIGKTSGIVYDSPPFSVTRVRKKKWVWIAIPAALLTAGLTYWLLFDGIDPPEPVPVR